MNMLLWGGGKLGKVIWGSTILFRIIFTRFHNPEVYQVFEFRRRPS